jgi:hypothetical protein
MFPVDIPIESVYSIFIRKGTQHDNRNNHRRADPLHRPLGAWCWGAKNMMSLPKGLSFKTSGAVKWKGTVTVALDEGKDLYVVKFTRLRKLNIIVDEIIEDVFVEDLVGVIDARVG